MESGTGKQIQNLCQQFVTKLSLEYKPLTKEGQIEVLIYNSLLSLFSIQNRMNSKEYEVISDEVYIYLIKEISYIKLNLTVEDIVEFIQKRFNLYKNEIYNMFEGDRYKVLEKSYYYFYIKPLSVTDENISNNIELVGFTNKIMFLSYKLRDSINELFFGENNKLSAANAREQECGFIDLGGQIWMAKTLRVKCFKNGDPIQEAKTCDEWYAANQNNIPIWGSDILDPKKEKLFYNYSVISDPRGIAPDGWHIPTEFEIDIMIDNINKDKTIFDNFKKNFELDPLLNHVKYWTNSNCGNNNIISVLINYNNNIFSHIKLGRPENDCRILCIKDVPIGKINMSIPLNKPKLRDEYKCNLLKDAENRTKLKDYHGAIELYNKLLDYDDSDFETFYKRGIAYYNLEGDEIINAKSDFHKTILLAPDYTEAYYYRGLCKSVLFRSSTDFFSRSIVDFDKTIELDPNHGLAYAARGMQKKRIGDHKGALYDFNKAIELSPTIYEKLCCDRARLSLAFGDYEGALQDYNNSIKLYPHISALFTGRACAKSHLNDKSLFDDIEIAIELDPDDEYIYMQRGFYRYEYKDYLGALADFDFFIDKTGGCDGNVFLNRSRTKLELKDYNGALTDFNEFLTFVPSITIDMFFERAKIKTCLNDYYGAMLDYNHVIAENSNHSDALCNLGIIYHKINDNKSSISYLLRAVKLGNTLAKEYIHKFNLNASLIETNSGVMGKSDFSKNNNSGLPNNNKDGQSKNDFLTSYEVKKTYYLNIYKTLLSEDDFINIKKKVRKSGVINVFISKCKSQYYSFPSAEIIVKQICQARSFMFVFNCNKITVASIELFDWWIKEVNSVKYYLNEEELVIMLDQIVIYCDRLAKGKF